MKARVIGVLVILSIGMHDRSVADRGSAGGTLKRSLGVACRDVRPTIAKPVGLDDATRHFSIARPSIVAPLLARVAVGGTRKSADVRVRFAPVHIYLDSSDKPLAAYQFELKAKTGRIKIVGVEGGGHPAFQEAPYYDPAALMNDRIIIAAFNTGTDLPHGRTRIATIHLQILGDAEPQYELKLAVAADTQGENLPATLNFETGEQK